MLISAAALPAMAACAIHEGTARPAPSAAWLAAVWSQDAEACGAGAGSLRFEPDGTYKVGDESGRWDLSGNSLSIVQTAQTDGSGQSSPVAGQPVSLQIERAEGDRLHVTWPSGERYLYSRCD